MKLLLTSLFSRLNPYAVRRTLYVLVGLGLLAGAVQGVEYATGWLARRHGLRQHQQATAEHRAVQQQGEADHTQYRIDSAARAQQRVALLRQQAQLAQKDYEIRSTRPARRPLPAANDLPRERSAD